MAFAKKNIKIYISACAMTVLVSCGATHSHNLLQSENRVEGELQYKVNSYDDGCKGVELNEKEIYSCEADSVSYLFHKPGSNGFFKFRNNESATTIVDTEGNEMFEPKKYAEASLLTYYKKDNPVSEEDKEPYFLLKYSDSEGETYQVASFDGNSLLEEVCDGIEVKDHERKERFSYLICSQEDKKAIKDIHGRWSSLYIEFDDCEVKTLPAYEYDDYGGSPVTDELYFDISLRQKHGAIEKDGTYAVPPNFSYLEVSLEYQPDKTHYLWFVEGYDSTRGVYYKGKELVPTGKYDDAALVCRDGLYYIATYCTVSDWGFACGAYDIDGNEVVPPLKDCYVEYQDGKFLVAKNNDDFRDLVAEHTWEDAIRFGGEVYSPSKHSKYAYNPGKRSGSGSGVSDGGNGGNAAPSSYSSPAPVVSQPVQYQEFIACYDCQGSGRCRYCNGDGWDFVRNSYGEILTSQQCPICHGNKTCQACAGTRGHYETRFR